MTKEVAAMAVCLDPPYARVKVWMLKELENAARLPRLARRELRAWVGDHAALADLELITSELVTNALVHGGGAWVRLSLEAEELGKRGYWRVTVVDPGRSASVPMPRMPAPGETSGRGLWLVDELTDGCWGTGTRVGERAVWALLPLMGRSQKAASAESGD
ncbi:ATP-binding protein [Nonomuraea fuscirosea]|uniref:ATP-binding protein n=1 Tax=Nonomuraea fuscirosea TaxID=1291556 RepID=UPI00378A84C1